MEHKVREREGAFSGQGRACQHTLYTAPNYCSPDGCRRRTACIFAVRELPCRFCSSSVYLFSRLFVFVLTYSSELYLVCHNLRYNFDVITRHSVVGNHRVLLNVHLNLSAPLFLYFTAFVLVKTCINNVVLEKNEQTTHGNL